MKNKQHASSEKVSPFKVGSLKWTGFNRIQETRLCGCFHKGHASISKINQTLQSNLTPFLFPRILKSPAQPAINLSHWINYMSSVLLRQGWQKSSGVSRYWKSYYKILLKYIISINTKLHWLIAVIFTLTLDGRGLQNMFAFEEGFTDNKRLHWSIECCKKGSQTSAVFWSEVVHFLFKRDWKKEG